MNKARKAPKNPNNSLRWWIANGTTRGKIIATTCVPISDGYIPSVCVTILFRK